MEDKDLNMSSFSDIPDNVDGLLLVKEIQGIGIHGGKKCEWAQPLFWKMLSSELNAHIVTLLTTAVTHLTQIALTS